MNPYKLREIYKYLTRAKKTQPDLPDVFPASQAPIPAKTKTVEEIEAINRFMRANPRQDMAGGGMLVQPSADGSRPGYRSDKVQKAGNRYGQFTSESMNNVSDAILKAYAEDDISLLFEKNKQNPTGLISSKDSKQGIFSKIREDPSRIDFIVKNTGLDEETIFNILDDRTAYLELEKGSSSQKTRFKDRMKFFNKAEKWLTTNAKRYSDPVKFEKAFARTFGKNNLITKTIKANITDPRGKGRLSGFSDDFIKTIMATSQGIDPTKTSSAFNSTQLKDMFKTVIYNNNPNVRKRITTIFENILPEPGSKRTPDVRKLFENDPVLKKFGLDKSIKGPIARLIANEINEDLLTNVKNFQKPFLGTDALLSFLKDRVDPKYKEMFREAGNAVKQAQKNEWPQAKKTLNLSQAIMFDHKIPKSIIDLGYADEIEYIKLNPTSEKFNATIKRSQFDQPMLNLISKFENSKSLDAKAAVVKEMNDLKNKFSKKYGGYLDEVTITPDKTGKPIFTSSASPVTKKTDFVSSLGKSMVQTGEITQKKANILSAFCNSRKKLNSGSGSLTCSMEEIQTNMKKQINEAARASKDGKIPKRFGKLRAVASGFFGDVALPLEYMFMAPDLVAGDIDGALRSSTAGLFGAGKVDLEQLPPGEGRKYIRHTNAITNFLNNYQSKLVAEDQLKNLKPGDEEQFVASDQLAQAEKNMADIVKDYQGFGYTYQPGEKGLLEGKVAAQKLIRDKVTSDFDKKIDKGASTEFFKDSNKDLLKENLKSLGGDPFTVTPINNLEDYIKNKGEATAGNTNIFFNRLPYTLEQAEAYGVPDIFNTYAGGYAGVETPGSMEKGQEIDMGIKDVRDAYSSLPINMASELAALEKKELEEGMLKRRLENQLFAGGGIAKIAGDSSGRPPVSGPNPQGLLSLKNRVRNY
jgi:hypothetical protein